MHRHCRSKREKLPFDALRENSEYLLLIYSKKINYKQIGLVLNLLWRLSPARDNFLNSYAHNICHMTAAEHVINLISLLASPVIQDQTA